MDREMEIIMSHMGFKIVSDALTDLVSSLLYYDRKEDEDLPRGAIEGYIEDGLITVDGIVKTFEIELIKGLTARKKELTK